MRSLSAIILAAGSGERMRASVNKALLPLAGTPVLCYALKMWQPLARQILVAAQPGDWPEMEPLLAPYGEQAQLVAGGASRAASLAHALAALRPCADAAQELIAVHDAARPLTSPTDIQRALNAAKQCGAAILAAPVTDTLRFQVEDTNPFSQEQTDGLCGAVLPREKLLAAQTPQIFRRDWLVQAYANADEQMLASITDDAALLQAAGHLCAYVWAEGANFKLTKPEDMVMAEAILTQR